MTTSITYGEAILSGFHYLLSKHSEVFVIGQGLWSPWYVGNSMTGLDKEFGQDRIIDSPVSELGVTGAAVGASLCGYRPIVVHPRMDFMILAMDQIVNQAAKWSHMFGGQTHAAVTVRGIVNRGGEQGAQHSQSLHSWFAHIPGLRVVMPSTPEDARDLLIASVLSNDPVLYIDDRWLYGIEQEVSSIVEKDLSTEGPKVIREGTDCTLVGNSYSTQLCLEAAKSLDLQGVSCEVIDLRVVSPLIYDEIIASVEKTKRLCVVDGGWSTCGLAGEIIAGVSERTRPSLLEAAPIRLTLPNAPAPTSAPLESTYYFKSADIVAAVLRLTSSEVSRNRLIKTV
ncbi:MAG: alpha-ketoacid dehydrogenase subunit beta [Candidatus Manganitrophus sp. SA1]|nr:alpha-ketoacid dehydrogenase subunit beta [Candidatus Manganitrophus morganii]